jgi:hypothetical protein
MYNILTLANPTKLHSFRKLHLDAQYTTAQT